MSDSGSSGADVGREIRHALEARGIAWPAAIEYSPRIASTSVALKERARHGLPGWTVLLAGEQTEGHGRQGQRWISPPGNLYLSVLLASVPRPETLLPLAAGVAVGTALAEIGVAAQLKWPNDVLVAERKIAGILTEGVSEAGALDWAILGIGVNVDPAEPLPEGATSLRAVLGSGIPRWGLGAAILAAMWHWYHRLAEGASEDLRVEWRRRAVAWWGRPVEARFGERMIRGTAEGIDAAGALVLKGGDGSLLTLLSGDVREVRSFE